MLLIFLIFILIICVIIRLYFRLTNGICHDNETKLNGKIIVITGGNTGIGSEYVLEMVRRNCSQIIMACRNVSKGEQCVRWINEKIKTERIQTSTLLIVKQCDLSSFDSVVRFCNELKHQSSHVKHIDYLICFAAATGIPLEQKFTNDGYEMHFQCNYLSHLLIIYLLLPLLNNGGRVILTSSQAHMFGKIDLKNISHLQRYDRHPFCTYGDSKLALVMLAKKLSKLFATKNIQTYSFHPGTVLTNGIKLNQIWYLKIILTIVAFFYGKSHRDGAQTMIYLTVTSANMLSNGQYYSDCSLASYNPVADDNEMIESLWSYSYELIEKYLDEHTKKYWFENNIC